MIDWILGNLLTVINTILILIVVVWVLLKIDEKRNIG